MESPIYHMDTVEDRVRFLLHLPEGREYLETRRAYMEVWERRYGKEEDRKTKELFAEEYRKRQAMRHNAQGQA